MKILLIDIPFGSHDIGGIRNRFSGVENKIPSLGLAYIASVAELEGHEVRVLDCNVPSSTHSGWAKIQAEGNYFRPDVVGMTITTPSVNNALKTVRIMREINPNIVSIAGGSHPTIMPEQITSFDLFNFIVLGEGEQTFTSLLQYIDGNYTELQSISGIAYKKDNRLYVTKKRKMIKNLDSIPLPARHLFPPLKFYQPTPASYRKLPLAHIMTSRGCPSRCNFCDRSVFGEIYRRRSVDNIMMEIEDVVKNHNAREIRFFDDTFTLKRERLVKICSEIKKFRPKIPWTCLTKVNCVDLDMLKMMYDAGCWQVLYGLESGDDNILKTLGKKNTVKQNIQAVQWAREAGLRVRADFLVGTPSETVESLFKTLDFAKKLDIDFAHFNKFIPFPGTSFYRQLVTEGYQFNFSKSSTLDHDAIVYLPPAIPEHKYREFLDFAYKKFYLRAGYLFKRLFAIRTLTELKGNLQGAIAMKSI
ncbi:MAG: Radical SAM domain protein [Candidatus Magnetoglobus multicellularis str. Araruama]|uniref:Radical SAM domain protein n=1 Tax=Candidatus Magnetoglobus multicellularis str. Araruama TaxID=890399 RepID=A0A1V1PFR3_9BACT|nr:MAG: Radical SAM domain protein [Candidatus Magnetoglobus multicellularis str. Araruama]